MLSGGFVLIGIGNRFVKNFQIRLSNNNILNHLSFLLLSTVVNGATYDPLG